MLLFLNLSYQYETTAHDSITITAEIYVDLQVKRTDLLYKLAAAARILLTHLNLISEIQKVPTVTNVTINRTVVQNKSLHRLELHSAISTSRLIIVCVLGVGTTHTHTRVFIPSVSSCACLVEYGVQVLPSKQYERYCCAL